MNFQYRESPFPLSEAGSGAARPGPVSWTRFSEASGAAALVLLAAGFVASLLCGPATGGSADSHRIVFLHWPALWMSWGLYAALAALSVAALRGGRLAAAFASAIAPTGLMFTFLALWTGALWMKPIRGSWWAWDAPFATEMLLFVLYGGVMVARDMMEGPRAERASALLALAGAAAVPLPALVSPAWPPPGLAAALRGFPDSTGRAAVALALVTAGFAAYALCIGLKRARCVIAEREWIAWAVGRPGERPP